VKDDNRLKNILYDWLLFNRWTIWISDFLVKCQIYIYRIDIYMQLVYIYIDKNNGLNWLKMSEYETV